MIAESLDKFHKFEIHSTTYKSVNEQPIGVDVLVPKNKKPALLPVIVRFHGGYLVTGASLFPFFFAGWLLDYAALNSAIIVSADYRLLPESSACDILEDLSDFWNWFQNNLKSYLASERATAEADFDRILVVGDSAGGYLAVQSAITQQKAALKAIIGIYPMIDIGSDFFAKKSQKIILGHSAVTNEIVDEHMQSVKAGTIVSSAIPPARFELAVAIVQNGRFLDFFGTDPSLFPLETASQAPSLPPFFIFHGKEDTALPVEGSTKFVELLKTTHPETEVKLELPPGDHGLDQNATLDTPWLKEGLSFITQRWLV